MKSLNRSAAVLKAKQEFVDWLISVKPELHRLDIALVNRNLCVYLFEIEDQDDQGMEVSNQLENIIKNELCNSFYISKELWPKEIDCKLFAKWFSYDYIEEVYDVANINIETYED